MAIEEYAPGIPSKTISHDLPEIESPTTWQFGIHSHEAERRGHHFDLRLGDPKTGHAHSWALPPKWPKPGESAWAVQQPTHTIPYMDFVGRIHEGYGKGNVSLLDRDKTEIINSRPGHISFNVYRGAGPEEYTLHKVDDRSWRLYNRTSTRDKYPSLPDSKPKYKEVHPSRSPVDDPNYIASAKIDDAHNLFYFPSSGEQVRVFSYRPSKRSGTGLIEHTHKVPGLLGLKTPKGLGGTVIRGGLYGLSPRTGKATDVANLAGILNSDVWKSRDRQQEHGVLLPVLYDVARFRGADTEHLPYSDKLKILHRVVEHAPSHFTLPRMAYDQEDKKKLLRDIGAGKIPETKEGVVFWHLNKAGPPIKAKFTKEHDVYVRSFFPGKGRLQGNSVGGFYFSHEPHGDIVGKVGTGLDDKQRRDMHQNPDRYIGLVARVKAQDKFRSGALRAPAFDSWHLDKNDPIDLERVKLASSDLELVFLWGNAIA